MQRRTMIYAAAAVVALAALLTWAFVPRPLEVEVATASVGPFETSIDEDGRTRLLDRYVVSAPLAGRLQRIALREGDAVQAGAVVAHLSPLLAPLLDERTLAELRARVDVSQASVQRAATRNGAAKVALEQARSALRRTEQLAQQGFVAPTTLDAERLALQAAQKELETAIEDQHIAGHGLEQARAALVAARAPSASGGAFAVSAPVPGRVMRVLQASEAVVALGTPLLEIGDTSRLEIVADLLTGDALQATPGRLVRIERWGGPGSLEGRVRLVEPAAFTKVSALGVEEQRVKVLIELTSPPEQWRALGDGFRVGVRIVTLSQAQVLRVPASAVFPRPAQRSGQGGGHAVFVLDGDRARLQAVEIGGRNGSDAWVLKGLQAGTKVIVYPPAAVADGARVSARSTTPTRPGP
jgi:HlyD family secretion protein